MNEQPAVAPEQRIVFLCSRCPVRYGSFADLVTHYEGRHSPPALDAFTQKRFVKKEA